MQTGAHQQMLALGRFIGHPAAADLRMAMAAADLEGVAQNWHGPGWRRRGYHLKLEQALGRI